MNWIPITERLPEHGQDVLFCCLIDDEFTRVECGRYNGNKTAGDAIAVDVDVDCATGEWSPCSHWMPLPEPPSIDEQNVAEPQSAAIGPLNLNTYVRFKMKPRGVEVARAYFAQCGFEFPNVLFPVDQPDIECRQQFHDLFRIFGGQHMRHDCDGNPLYGLIVEPMPR